MKSLLGEVLLSAGIINQEQLNKGLEAQKKYGKRLAHNLITLGFLKEEEALFYLSQKYGISSVDLRNFDIKEDVIKLIPHMIAKKYKCIPLNLIGNDLTLAMVDPTNYHIIDDLTFLTGMNVEVAVTTESLFEETYKKYYLKKTSISLETMDYLLEDQAQQTALKKGEDDTVENITNFSDFSDIVKGAVDTVEVVREEKIDEAFTESDAPIVKLVNGILLNAMITKASDIHIEPFEKELHVRYRIDGELKGVMRLPPQIKTAVVSRLKVISELNLAQRRLPQDGRIKLRIGKNRSIDYRVSILPTRFGEKAVLRLLDTSNLQLDLKKLGFCEEDMEMFLDAIHCPYGMVLVTGPTGSGKSTTLYSALSHLNDVSKNIITAEDPVEFDLPGIIQVQMHEQIGLTFAAALRSFLRQDPDIIMVGEIRDLETAEIAVKSALTGHLVLSTLHTNDAPSTIMRLVDMGIESFLVSSSVLMVIAQRLVRKICNNCKEKIEVHAPILKNLGFSEKEIGNDLKIYRGKGCSECYNTGYKGRIGLYEILTMTDAIKELIVTDISVKKLRDLAIKEGMRTLRQSGLDKIKQGLTTIEEVIAVTF